MNWYSDEERQQIIRQEIDARREAAAVFPHIRKAIRDFDGKVYNCRFEKALQAAIEGKAPGRIRTQRKYFLEIQYYPSVIMLHGYSVLTLACVKAGNMPGGKRIPAALLDESLREHREELLLEAARIESDAAQADAYRRQIEDAKRLLERMISGIDPTVREIYNLIIA